LLGCHGRTLFSRAGIVGEDSRRSLATPSAQRRG
jgi:hypothetical protein